MACHLCRPETYFSVQQNGTGIVIESIYIVVFLLYAPKKEKTKILALLLVVLSIFTLDILVSLFALHGHARKLFCGIAAAVFSIIMYGSPLTIIILVIKTKSVEFMPFLLSVCVTSCGTCWCIFGILIKDPFVAVPNGFGCGLGAVQLTLYAIYRNNKGQYRNESTNMEMG
ncbi:Nodulin MtN3 family protein [Perilla frutescens var. frutescens]|nr:Nodulin MtN3 family protein [Perilla frutescens var. frutescens]